MPLGGISSSNPGEVCFPQSPVESLPFSWRYIGVCLYTGNPKIGWCPFCLSNPKKCTKSKKTPIYTYLGGCLNLTLCEVFPPSGVFGQERWALMQRKTALHPGDRFRATSMCLGGGEDVQITMLQPGSCLKSIPSGIPKSAWRCPEIFARARIQQLLWGVSHIFCLASPSESSFSHDRVCNQVL